MHSMKMRFGKMANSRMKLLLHLCLAALTAVAINAHAAALPREARVPGGVAIVRVADATAPEPSVTREGVRVWVVKHRIGKQAAGWYAVVGIPLGTKLGSHTLAVTREGVSSSVAYKVTGKKYPVQKLTFDNQRMVDPIAEDLVRINRESKHLGEVKRAWRESADTRADFQLPAKGRLSSRFGLQRVLNGKPRSPHAGLDVAVPAGTPIMSAADGVVLDTGDYYYNGQTVWVDHGNGLITLYCHLSEIKVMSGEPIKKGQLLGLSGMTGRSTGPHLHWGVLLNTVMVEPELFLPRDSLQ